jgi:hypothetical protein
MIVQSDVVGVLVLFCCVCACFFSPTPIIVVIFYLEQIFHAFIVPNPPVSSLFDRGASFADTPNRLRNGGRVVQVHVGELLLDGIGSHFGFVMRNRRVKVVGHVGRSNLVVQEINGTKRVEFVIGTIDSMQSSLYKIVVALRIVWNIDIGVLKPVFRGETSNINKCRYVDPSEQHLVFHIIITYHV